MASLHTPLGQARGLVSVRASEVLSWTRMEAVSPHSWDCPRAYGVEVGTMGSHCLAFKSHLHPSLASYITSPCLSFHTADRNDILKLLVGEGQVRSKALGGSPDPKRSLHGVFSAPELLGISVGEAQISGPSHMSLGYPCHLLKLAS